MEQYEPFAIVQKVAREGGHFNVKAFKRLISELDKDEFDKFCHLILRLTEFHDSNVGAVCTDDQTGIPDNVAAWALKGIENDNGYEDPTHSDRYSN